jgi:hypothetical protein
MDETSKEWMEYIDREVRAACEKQGWGSQIRRKWSGRDKPVSESSVDDYEWKLIPGADARLPERGPSDLIDEGTYYVLSLDRRGSKLILQHDTAHCGDHGPHWFVQSYTEIQILGLYGIREMHEPYQRGGGVEPEGPYPVPSEDGRLEDYLVQLTSRFKPNCFSIT